MPEKPLTQKKQPRRRCISAPAHEWATPLLKPIMKKYGLAEQQLLNRWPDIVGPYFAQISHPERLRFPRGERNNGTLHIRVASGWATELQHQQPILLEKLAVFYGYKAIARITLTQDPLLCVPPQPATPPPAISQKSTNNLNQLLENIEDRSLRKALTQLGTAIYRHKEKIEHTGKDA